MSRPTQPHAIIWLVNANICIHIILHVFDIRCCCSKYFARIECFEMKFRLMEDKHGQAIKTESQIRILKYAHKNEKERMTRNVPFVHRIHFWPGLYIYIQICILSLNYRIYRMNSRDETVLLFNFIMFHYYCCCRLTLHRANSRMDWAKAISRGI